MVHLWSFFFFNDTATTEIYTLSLHDALPISRPWPRWGPLRASHSSQARRGRSEEHTSELQSQSNLVCRLLLEKKKTLTFPLVSSPLHDMTQTASQTETWGMSDL